MKAPVYSSVKSTQVRQISSEEWGKDGESAKMANRLEEGSIYYGSGWNMMITVGIDDSTVVRLSGCVPI